MKILLITLFLIGCGADPDDFIMEESDGCKSNDTECKASDPAVEESDKVLEKTGDTEEKENSRDIPQGIFDEEGNLRNQEYVDKNCQVNKLCRGADKEYVISLMGDPAIMEKKGTTEVWQWREFGVDRHACGTMVCQLTFKNGLLFQQKDIASSWLDLNNF